MKGLEGYKMDCGTLAEWVGKLKTTDAAILNKSDPGS